MHCTLTAVPRLSGIPYCAAVEPRAVVVPARGTPPRSPPRAARAGLAGTRFPVAFCTFSLYFATRASRSFAVELACRPSTLRAVLAAVRMCSNSRLRNLEDDVGVHLDEPPVGVEREAAVAGASRQPFDGPIVEPEVQDRVHHSGHRELRPRPDRNQKRIVVVAEPLCPASASSRAKRFGHLGVEPLRHRRPFSK